MPFIFSYSEQIHICSQIPERHFEVKYNPHTESFYVKTSPKGRKMEGGWRHRRLPGAEQERKWRESRQKRHNAVVFPRVIAKWSAKNKLTMWALVILIEGLS